MNFTPDELGELDTPASHMEFISVRWLQFAAFAWQKYLTEGRGAVVIDLRNASKNESQVHIPAFYVAEGSESLAKRGGWPSGEVADVIEEYDPEQDVVFI